MFVKNVPIPQTQYDVHREFDKMERKGAVNVKKKWKKKRSSQLEG